MSDPIRLTLEPTAPVQPDPEPSVPDPRLNQAVSQTLKQADAAIASGATAAAVQKAPAPKPVSADEIARPTYSPEETEMLKAFSKKIDIGDANLVFSYGASAQRHIADFSDSALQNVQTKDLGEVGDMIGNLVNELRGFTVDDDSKGGLFGLFRKPVDKMAIMKTRFDHAEVNVNKIVECLEGHQIQLLKDIATLDQLYDQNLNYFKELSMYIEAGKMRIDELINVDLAKAKAYATHTGLPEDAQAANDLANKIDRFQKKIYDLELTRNISLQMAPQIRLLQNSNQMMAEKIQSSLVNTIPLWKSQMVLALGLQHTEDAMQAQRSVTDLTNELLRKNAEKLHMATVETAKEAERGIVDIETLRETNASLIQSMDEVLNIQQQGRERRKAAEAELAQMESELRAKLLELNP